MKRTLFSEEHELFRQAFRHFVEREVKPHQERWMEQHQVDREVCRKAGEAGFLCTWLPERTAARAATSCTRPSSSKSSRGSTRRGFAASLHSDVVVPYLYHFGDDAQKQRWLARLRQGRAHHRHRHDRAGAPAPTSLACS